MRKGDIVEMEVGRGSVEYELEEILGRGGFGKVFRGRNVEDDKDIVAVKAFSNESEEARKLKLEYTLTKKAGIKGKEYVIGASGLGKVKGRNENGIVMPYMSENLEDILKKDLKYRRKEEIAREIILGLNYLHIEGIVHGDIKPSNILFNNDGTENERGKGIKNNVENEDFRNRNVKITDFGLATIYSNSFLEKLFKFFFGWTPFVRNNDMRGGTFSYMSPETLNGKKITKLSDQYSLSVLFFELFTGKKPFHPVSLGNEIRNKGNVGNDHIKQLRKAHYRERKDRTKNKGIEEMEKEFSNLSEKLGRRKISRGILKGMSFNPKDRFYNLSVMNASMFGSNY